MTEFPVRIKRKELRKLGYLTTFRFGKCYIQKEIEGTEEVFRITEYFLNNITHGLINKKFEKDLYDNINNYYDKHV
jgi:hypothetical protein